MIPFGSFNRFPGKKRMAFGQGSGGTPTPTAPITAVSALGYIATYNGTPASLQPGDTFALTRQGYDGSYTSPSGVPTPTLNTAISETISVRNRQRNPYPDDLSEPVWHASNVALSTYAYSTDSAAGVTNSSAEASPKPTCGWAVTDRRVVGNSINLQLVAFHRNARNRQQVACVVFSATDGTTTAYALVAASSVLTTPGGALAPFSDIACEGFETTLDITALADNADITVNASVFPWIGDSSSVAQSSSANEYEFAPLVFRKNTAKAAAPPFAYIATTGVDAVCDVNGQAAGITKVSTTAATAKANPFLTWNSAIQALKAATNVTGGFIDGCEVRLVDGTAMGATNMAVATYIQTAGVTVTRDPASANRAAAAFTIGTGINNRFPYIRFTDMKIIRGANVAPAFTKAIMENVDLDNGSFSSIPFGANVYWTGVTIVNCAAGMMTPGASPHNLIRGCTVTSGVATRPEAGVCIGNKLGLAGVSFLPNCSTTRQVNRFIVAFNKFTNISVGGSTPLWAGLAGNYNNSIFVGNLCEYTASGTASIVHPSGDGETYSLPGLVFTDNTFAGAYQAGRVNALYDETIGTYRNQKLVCIKRNVFTSITTKGDYFIGVNGGASGAESVLHIGNHNVLYAVDTDENFCQWPDALAIGYGTDSLERRWANCTPYTIGARSSKPNGAAGFVEFLLDAKFKTPAATTYVPAGTPNAGAYTAGAGGGDYRPKRISQGDAADSPLLGQVLNPGLRFGLDGTARVSTNDTIGAYA